MKMQKLKSFLTGASLVLGLSLISPLSASAAWKQDSNGWWNTEGNSYSVGWRMLDNSWYYFGADGYMQTGWINSNGSWYYLGPNGDMKTGWIKDNGTWYYLNTNGVMKTGWVKDNNLWYYLSETGSMKTGFLNLNDKTYYLNESGAMVIGDITLDGVKYSFNENGEKISSTNTSDSNTTVSNNADTSNENNSAKENQTSTENDKTSGGGGGGNSSSSDSELPSYSDLYGTWKVSQYISNSGIESDLSGLLINSAIGEKFTVSEDKISAIGHTVKPTFDESDITNSDFKNKYGVNLSKIEISDSNVKSINISIDEYPDMDINIIVAKNNKTVAIVNGAPFKLSKVK